MTPPVSLAKDIFWVGVNDHTTDLFESIWPLPRGVTYNSYLIDAGKTALIDTVKKNFYEEYIGKIRGVLNGRTLDYVVVNHMEPDHSGALLELLKLYPQLIVVGNEKTAEFLKNFYRIDTNVKIVKDRETLELGSRTLEFYLTPMVHWPETMMTYEKQDGILFSGDAFGGFAALDKGVFDDQVDPSGYEEETRRYFSNIVAKYSAMVLKAMQMLAHLDIRMVASTHGLIYRQHPRHVIELYRKWSSYEADAGVVIAYGSMYGNTLKMVEACAGALEAGGIKPVMHDASRTHLSFIVNDVWKYAGLIIASPTYNMSLFPPIDAVVTFLDHTKVKNRSVGIIESHGWSGGASACLQEFIQRNQLRFVEPLVEARCAPTQENLVSCSRLAQAMAQAVRKA